MVSGVALQLRQVQRCYGDKTVLQDISLQLIPGEVLALLGPSGCGKTTLLKILAGLEQPSAGEVWMGDRCIASAQGFAPPESRDLGMVFQDYALWPHMTVGANVAFPLEMRGLPRAKVRERVQETLALVGLQALGDRLPASLSGGQQQRVALARAIVARPRLLLFDEPLSNLDRDLRESLCLEMSQLLRKLGCTAVYVTHDHEEACMMADRVAVMMHGRILQLASPQALWSTPAHCEVAQFLKLGAIVPARRTGSLWQIAQRTLVRCRADADEEADFKPKQVLAPDTSAMEAIEIKAAAGNVGNHDGGGAAQLALALPVQAPVAQPDLHGAQALDLPVADPLPQQGKAQILVPHDAVQLGSPPSLHQLALAGQVLSQQYRCGLFHTVVQTEWDVPMQLHTSQQLPLRSWVDLGVDMRRLQWFAA